MKNKAAAIDKKSKNDFTKGDVRKIILQMSIPMTLAQVVNVTYSIVDRIYIGHIPGVGSLALTGLGLTMPIVSIINAFAAHSPRPFITPQTEESTNGTNFTSTGR